MTRPEAQSRRFVAQLVDRIGEGWPVILSPLLSLHYRDAALPLAGVSDLIFTSETAVAAFCRLSDRRDIAVWAVGPRTADAARARGFSVRTGPGTAEGLATRFAPDNPYAIALWARGSEVAFPLGQALSSAGTETREVVLYDQVELSPAEEAIRALQGHVPVVVPIFSPRTARIFAGLAARARAPLTILCLSPAVAEGLSGQASAEIVVADRPDGEAMLAATAKQLRRDHQG